MKKYKGMYYTTKKQNGSYHWTIYKYYHNQEVLEISKETWPDEVFETKGDAESSVKEAIDAYYI